MEQSTENNATPVEPREGNVWNHWDAYLSSLQFSKDAHGIK